MIATHPEPITDAVRSPHDRRDLPALVAADPAHDLDRRASRTRRRRARPAPPEQSMLATVAHEIRGPVAALATSSELLVDDLELLDHDQVRGMVSAIHRRALYLQGLVENLLCAGLIRQGSLTLHRRSLDLAELLADTRTIVEPLLSRRQQTLRVRVQRQVPAVVGDARRLGQVLTNLVLNASKFAEPGTAVDVTVTVDGDLVRVSVADRGPGLPTGEAGRLFEPYFRAQDVRTCGTEGIGLGLSIVKSIVEAHAGRVGAEARRGGGARFWFELPHTVASR
jgi:signal transduction histidine kinase